MEAEVAVAVALHRGLGVRVHATVLFGAHEVDEHGGDASGDGRGRLALAVVRVTRHANVLAEVDVRVDAAGQNGGAGQVDGLACRHRCAGREQSADPAVIDGDIEGYEAESLLEDPAASQYQVVHVGRGLVHACCSSLAA